MIEIGRVHLEDCSSLKKAFYQLFLFDKEGVNLIEKKSGGGGKVFDRRV